MFACLKSLYNALFQCLCAPQLLILGEVAVHTALSRFTKCPLMLKKTRAVIKQISWPKRQGKNILDWNIIWRYAKAECTVCVIDVAWKKGQKTTRNSNKLAVKCSSELNRTILYIFMIFQYWEKRIKRKWATALSWLLRYGMHFHNRGAMEQHADECVLVASPFWLQVSSSLLLECRCSVIYQFFKWENVLLLFIENILFLYRKNKKWKAG